MNKLEPRIFKHTILQGEDDERLRELRKVAADLKPKEGDADVAYEDACRVADEFAAEAAERGVTVILRALGRKRWVELAREHPPTDDAADVTAGVAVLPFTEAVLMACLSSPALSDDERLDFLDSLTPFDYDVLQGAVWALHKGPGANPKDRLLSAQTGS